MTKTNRFQVFFDGDCPLCKREIDWLRKRDRQQEIEFIDIASPDFREELYGKSFDELMSGIHGRTRDGCWVKGVDVFRYLYDVAGFRRWVRWSRLPLIRTGLAIGYRIFARYRLRLTGRRTRVPSDSRSMEPLRGVRQ